MATSGFTTDQYELLDFGLGRKLERFGEWILDREAPATETQQRSNPALWETADLVFKRSAGDDGQWSSNTLPSNPSNENIKKLNVITETGAEFAPWEISFGEHFKLQLQLSPVGHIGVFPEQAKNWAWIMRQVRRGIKAFGEPIRVLNLFGYTGGSTLAAAVVGAEVTHVDSAGNIVERARENAKISGLQDAPIRWIQEDAQLFCQREVKRGNTYHAVILDPPSYGHGPKNQAWKINQHLGELLTNCGELTREQRSFMLLTSHTVGLGAADLEAMFADR
ncbi:MAG: class I SAM-dependent methyltransferase, partial [Pirellulaceae bacterium]|nr:class I SAM-dependent methyltransferase [Pirellulaceae bacterium]